MKLKNKLLPLVGVATACAAVAPIALTSCKSNNDGEWVDLMTKYTPSVKALDNQTLDTEGANKAYFGNEKDGWKSDEDVIAQFKDDYLWWLWKDEDASSDINYTEAKVKFDYFYVNHQTYTPSKGDAYKVPTFTFKVEFEGTRETTNKNYSTTTTYNIVNTVTNLPMSVWYNDEKSEAGSDPTWFVSQDILTIADNDESKSPIAWNVNEKVDYTSTISYPEYGYETTETYSNERICYTGLYDGSISGYAQFFRANSFGKNTGLMVGVGAKSHYMLSVQNGD